MDERMKAGNSEKFPGAAAKFPENHFHSTSLFPQEMGKAMVYEPTRILMTGHARLSINHPLHHSDSDKKKRAVNLFTECATGRNVFL
jgi:hypothetical protein